MKKLFRKFIDSFIPSADKVNTEERQNELARLRLAILEKEAAIRELETQMSVWGRFLFHALSDRTPCAGAFAPGIATINDAGLISRLASIANSRQDEHISSSFVWDIISQSHAEYIDQLDFTKLSQLAASPLTDGLLQGRTLTEILHNNEQQRTHWKNVAIDALLSLCEAMELIPIENIELNVRHNVAEHTPDVLLDAISRHVGFEVVAPDVFPGLFGLATKRGVFTFRHFIALYIAWRLAEKYPDQKDIRIAEIGAGAGLVAYYAWQFGFRDYSIFDLPTVNIVQSWFLGQSLREAPLYLADSPTPFGRPGIRVLPPEFLGQAPENFWDIVVNIDSIPEIAPDIVAKYLATIHSRSRMIYSYNHEARPPLDGHVYLGKTDRKRLSDTENASLCQETMAWHICCHGGFKRLSRCRAWLRPGYVEEWYEVVKGL